METAETHNTCYTIISNTFTNALPANQDGLYREIQYLNNSDMTIYLKDNNNATQEIHPSGMTSPTPHIEIRTRFVLGRRVDKRGYDTSKGNHHIISIPISTLQERPLYIASTDVVIMVGDFFYSTLHPHSDEHKQAEYEKMYADAIKKAQAAPFSLVANDPTQTFEKLYVLINDHICAVNVTWFQDEDIGDIIHFYYKDVETPSGTHQRCVKSSFKELRKIHDHVWEIEGCVLSPQYEILQYYLRNQDRIKKDGMISVHEADRQIKNTEEKAKRGHDEKDETIKHQKRKIADMEAYIKELESLGYSKESAVHQYDKLRHEKEKMEEQRRRDQKNEIHEKIKAMQDLQASMRKSDDDLWRATTAAIKTIGAAAPVTLTLYKIMKS